MSEEKPMAVAWEVEVNDHRCIVFATTAPKARWIAVKGWREAGYGRKGEWPSVSAGRRPYLDSRLGGAIQAGRAYSEEYVL